MNTLILLIFSFIFFLISHVLKIYLLCCFLFFEVFNILYVMDLCNFLGYISKNISPFLLFLLCILIIIGKNLIFVKSIYLLFTCWFYVLSWTLFSK